MIELPAGLSDAVVALLITIVAGGGGFGVVAFTTIRWLGEKWFLAKIEKKLTAIKHQNQKEIEILKYGLNQTSDRAARKAQLEFVVLPEIWSLLFEYHGHAKALVSPIQSYADLDRMSSEQLEDFITNSPLPAWQKSEIKGTNQKTRKHQEYYNFHRLTEVRIKARDYHFAFNKKAILLPKSIENGFKSLDQLIYDAIVEYEINLDPDMHPKIRDARSALIANGDTKIEELKNVIRAYLSDKIDKDNE